MRLQVVFVSAVVLAIVAMSDGFFIKKSKPIPLTLASDLASVKINLFKDAKTAVTDLKEAGHLTKKAVTGGITAIGKAKLGLVKSIKDAKIGLLKKIAGAKLAKLAAIKAGKIAFAKTLVAAKLAPVVLSHGIKTGAGISIGKNILEKLKDQGIGAAVATAALSSGGSSGVSSSGLFDFIGSILSGSSSGDSKPSGFVPYIGNILAKVTGNSIVKPDSADSTATAAAVAVAPAPGANLELYPAPSSLPTHINIVTYKNEAPRQFPSLPTTVNQHYSFVNEPSQQSSFPSIPATSYGAPIQQGPPATSYGTPIQYSPPATSYGTPYL